MTCNLSWSSVFVSYQRIIWLGSNLHFNPLIHSFVARFTCIYSLNYFTKIRNASLSEARAFLFMQVFLTLNISADLQTLFTWNTKQVRDFNLHFLLFFFLSEKYIVYKSNKLIIRYRWEVWKLILHILLYHEFNMHFGFTHLSVLGMSTDLVLLLFYACRFSHF